MLDFLSLVEARPENLERLAAAMGVSLPPRPDGPALLRWRRQAARTLADAIRAERDMLTRARAPW